MQREREEEKEVPATEIRDVPNTVWNFLSQISERRAGVMWCSVGPSRLQAVGKGCVAVTGGSPFSSLQERKSPVTLLQCLSRPGKL